jgi:hypothetical protein
MVSAHLPNSATVRRRKPLRATCHRGRHLGQARRRFPRTDPVKPRRIAYLCRGLAPLNAGEAHPEADEDHARCSSMKLKPGSSRLSRRL